MLSIGKMVAGSERYYLDTVARGREEYYTGSGEAPGQWLGSGSRLLGLVGEVGPDDLRAVLAGFTPDGGSLTAGRVRPEGRVSGFDLTFSAPKSVSLLYGLGDPQTTEVVKRVHAESVADALGYLGRNALRVRRGAGGERRIEAEGFIAAGFQHRTSRSGDPQLHTHTLVANVAQGVDGTWSAPDARLLYFHSRTAGFLYQAALRAGLSEALGVRFGPVVNGTAELEEVPPLLMKVFSTRRGEIERHMATAGTSSARAAEVAALVTRAPKEPEAGPGLEDPVALHDRWRDRAADLGLSDPGLTDVLCTHVPERVDQLDHDTMVSELLGPERLTEADSAFERRDVVRSVAERLPDGASVAEVEEIADMVLASPEVIPLANVGPGGELRRTTTELLSIEAALIQGALARAAPGPGEGTAVVDTGTVESVLARFPLLSPDQRAMVRCLTESGSGVEVVVGRAGSGKTTALAASRVSWRESGYKVVGTALAARAAKALEEGAGIPSITLARLLAGIESGRLELSSNHIVVVDEAGMIGTRQLGRLLDHAARAEAKVVLVGDPRQLPEIEAGGVLASLVERIGAIELTGNHRQREAWERSALDQLRHGNPLKGLAAFDQADRVHLAGSMANARSQMVEAWLAARSAKAESVMLAATRRDVATLNRQARAALREEGLLGRDLIELDGVGFAKGDTVICLRNDSALGVLNGTVGVVASSSDRMLTISVGRRAVEVPIGYVTDGHLAHGYATTIHKAQGLTVDRAFVLATDSLTREAGYVAMSRARKGTELFVPISAFEDGVPFVGHEPPDPLDGMKRRLLVSRAKRLAFDDRHDPFLSGRLLPATTTALPVQDPDHDEGELFEDRYLVAMLGPRPTDLDERVDYDKVARAVTSYRTHFRIEGDGLGPIPLEAHQRSAYRSVRDQLRIFQRRLGLSLELEAPDRGIGR